MGVAGQHVVGHLMVPSSDVAPLTRQWRGKKGAKDNQRYKKFQKAEKVKGEVYDAPRLKNLQKQNRLKVRKHYPKRRMTVPRTVPRAPFNNSSFLMRVRRSGGLASIVSPAPSLSMTPAYSSYKLGTTEPRMGFEGYGYGSMTGLIHLRPTSEDERSSGSTVDNDLDNMCVETPPLSPADHLKQLEQRVDRDVSRFEMIYPESEQNPKDVLEERLTRQDNHIAYLEGENMKMREQLFLMEQEVNELRQRLQGGQSCKTDETAEALSDYQS